MKSVNIKGKDYIEVSERVKEFHNLYKNGRISTEIISQGDGVIVMKSTVVPDIANPERYFTGLAYERENGSYINKTSYIENCETSSVGRALGFLGIGIDASIASADEVKLAIKQQSASKAPDKISGQDEEETEEMQALAAEVADMFKQAPSLKELEYVGNMYRDRIKQMSKGLRNWLSNEYTTAKNYFKVVEKGV
jgi:hypothetical protein